MQKASCGKHWVYMYMKSAGALLTDLLELCFVVETWYHNRNSFYKQMSFFEDTVVSIYGRFRLWVALCVSYQYYIYVT